MRAYYYWKVFRQKVFRHLYCPHDRPHGLPGWGPNPRLFDSVALARGRCRASGGRRILSFGVAVAATYGKEVPWRGTHHVREEYRAPWRKPATQGAWRS